MTSNTTAKQSLRGYIFDKLYSRNLNLSIDALTHLEQELDEFISKELILLDKAIHLARERGGYYNCGLNHAVWAYVLGLIGVSPYEYELTARSEQVDHLCLGGSSKSCKQCYAGAVYAGAWSIFSKRKR